MIAAALLVVGLAAVVVGFVLIRRSPGYRVGRTLAGARTVSIDDAIAAARGGSPRFVRLHGRISSEEEFPDEQDRPLVYRRRRIELAQPNGAWKDAHTETEGVPFGIEMKGSFIGVDGSRLGPGLVVIQRRAEGVAADLPNDLAAGVAPDTRARMVVEQISAVEHAWVAGVPQPGADGLPTMSAGLGRPLILSTVDLPDAMRLLGGEGRRALVIGVGCFVSGVGLAVAGVGGLILHAG